MVISCGKSKNSEQELTVKPKTTEIKGDLGDYFEVVDKDTNNTIGIIKSVDDSTMNTLFEIETTDGREVLIPANEDLIHEADMENRRIKMFIPEGLLNL